MAGGVKWLASYWFVVRELLQQLGEKQIQKVSARELDVRAPVLVAWFESSQSLGLVDFGFEVLEEMNAVATAVTPVTRNVDE